MISKSIRWRLTLWYFGTVAAILLCVAAGSWFAMRLSLNHALDRGLTYQLMGVRQFIAADSDADVPEIKRHLAEFAALNDLFQVHDQEGRLVCQSTSMVRHRVSPLPPPDADFQVRHRTAGPPGFPLRMAYQRVAVGSEIWTLEVAEPLRNFQNALREFTTLLWLSMPLLLLLATAGGYWLSSRALRPVHQLTEDARAITASSLSRRLVLPVANDELRRLAETLNQMLERIEDSFQRVRRFTADASHELRAPLTLIHTAAEFSLRRERSRQELVENMQKILDESKRTTRLVDDLLWLARADSERNAFQPGPVDLEPLLQEAGRRAAALGAARDIAVNLEIDPGPIRAHVDENAFRRLLLVLLDNAVKYTPAGGEVTLESRVDGGDVLISVVDTGIGIAPEDLPHIFERFWRADKVRSRESGGTGLGLSIAKEIADRHNARLQVSSVVGQGSTFTIRLARDGG